MSTAGGLIRPFLLLFLAATTTSSLSWSAEPTSPEVPPENAALAQVKPSSRPGVDWHCFLGPTHDSKSPERGIRTKWPADGLAIVWQRKLGTGYGSPAISRGRLFQFDRVGNNERLVALASETGEKLWEFTYPSVFEDMYGYDNGPRGSPIVDDDRVYIMGAQGMLHCLNVADGRQLWRLDTMKQFGVVENFFGVGSTPLVEGELLIVPIGGSPPEAQQVPRGQLNLVKGNGTAIVAFDKRSGQPRYNLSDELASYASPVVATIGDRRWCFHFARGGLLGFDPATGKIDFHFPWRATVLESVNASNPVVVGDLVFVSETYGPGGALLKVRASGYDVVWSDAERRRDKALQTHWNTAIHHDGHLYASSGRHSENAELRCIELRSGRVTWSQPDLTRSSLLYVDGHFVCLTEYGELILFEATPDRFAPLARVRPLRSDETESSFRPRPLLEYPAWAAPVLSHGLLYVRGRDRLVCMELIPAK
ncbi:MAG: PQQ-like beta-propeller repeat protein [Pirellulales bacterium]|nr:PQQ-like beta-propeller repeat protein [Pirellulales bacterium]